MDSIPQVILLQFPLRILCFLQPCPFLPLPTRVHLIRCVKRHFLESSWKLWLVVLKCLHQVLQIGFFWNSSHWCKYVLTEKDLMPDQRCYKAHPRYQTGIVVGECILERISGCFLLKLCAVWRSAMIAVWSINSKKQLSPQREPEIVYSRAKFDWSRRHGAGLHRFHTPMREQESYKSRHLKDAPIQTAERWCYSKTDWGIPPEGLRRYQMKSTTLKLTEASCLS